MSAQDTPSEPDTNRPEAATTRCVACGKEIPAGASVCWICKSYQCALKNHIMYVAGIFTMLALIISAVFWLWGNGRMLLGLARDDLRLVSANTVEGLGVVVNRGDRDVFVSHLLLTMPKRFENWKAPRLIFNERVSVGQFLQHEFPKPKLENAEFIRGLDAKDFEKLITRAANDDPCLELAFVVAQDSFLRELTQMAAVPKLNTFEVSGYLEYWSSTRNTPVDVPVKGTGVVRRALLPECR